MITGFAQTRYPMVGATLVVVTVTSDLAGTVYFHWYVDGAFAGVTTAAARTFHVAAGGQARIDVFDAAEPVADPFAAAPAAYPRHRTVWWVRSLATDVAWYRVDEQQDGGDWAAIARVPHDEATWSYHVLTDRLTDLASYAWRVVPVDAAGNDGTPVAADALTVVGRPDAPNVTVAFDDDTQKATFAAA